MKLLATTFALALLAGTAYAQDAAQPSNDAQSGQNQPQGQSSSSSSGQSSEQSSGGQQSASRSQVLVPIDNEDTPVPMLNLMAGQVEDMVVIGADDQEIGEVDELLGDQNGQAQAIVVEAGGFLGLGQRRIILLLDEVSLDMGRLRTDLTESEISDLPEYQG